MAKLKVHKDMTPGGSKGAAKITAHSINIVVGPMAARRKLMLSRMDGVPIRDGIHQLMLQHLNFEDLPKLLTSITMLRDHFLVAAAVLNKLSEVDRGKQQLDATKIQNAITTYVQAEGMIAATMASFAPALNINTRQGNVNSAMPGTTDKDGNFIPKSPNIAAADGQFTIPAVAAISNAAYASADAVDERTVMVDLVSYLIIASANELLNSDPVLSSSIGNKAKLDACIGLLGNVARATENDWSRPDGEDLPETIGLNSDIPAPVRDACGSGLLLPGFIFIIDQVVSLLMDSDVYNHLFNEQYSKVPRTQNESRRLTLERLAGYCHSLISAPLVLSKILVDNDAASMAEFAPMRWKSATFMNDNFEEHLGSYKTKALIDFAADLKASVNDPALQPYAGAPKVVFIECVALLGYGHIFHAGEAKYRKLGTVVGEISRPKDLLEPEFRSVLTGSGFAPHAAFMNTSLYIRANQLYDLFLRDVMTRLAPNKLSKISPAALLYAQDALNISPIPTVGPILVYKTPQFSYPVIMDDVIIDTPGAVPSTLAVRNNLIDHYRFSYFGNHYLLAELTLNTPPVFDGGMARRLRNAIGIGNWNAMYPADIMDGNHDYLGGLGSQEPMAILSLIGRMIGRSYAELTLDIYDRALFKTIVTTLSAGFCVFSIPNGPFNSKEDAFIAMEKHGFDVIEGHGNPYGLSYAQLALNCVIANATSDDFKPSKKNKKQAKPGIQLVVDVPAVDVIRDWSEYGGFVSTEFDVIIVPLKRIPSPSESRYTRAQFGTSFTPVLTAEPLSDSYIPLQSRTHFALAPALLNFAVHAARSSNESAPSTDFSISLHDFHANDFILSTAEYYPELEQLPSIGFKLPGEQSWAYNKVAPFISYVWYSPYATAVASSNDANQDPTSIIESLVAESDSQSAAANNNATNSSIAVDVATDIAEGFETETAEIV